MDDKITFRLYQIDDTLCDEIVCEYFWGESSDGTIPWIYKLVWESFESSNLDALYERYTSDKRPNKHCCKEISFGDVVEVEDSSGKCIFYICHMFGWTEFDFDKEKVKNIETYYEK